VVYQKELQESIRELQDPDSHRNSILFVDDEPGILEAVQVYLEDTGTCKVDTAESASEALEKMHEHPYDAIIADYIMPDIDGITFLQIVRKQYGEIPFILYTGVDREEVLIEAINNGVNFYLQKSGDPVPQFAELLHIIEQAVQRIKAEHALRESERRYRSIIENIIDVYFQTDRRGNLIFVSPSALTLLGYDSIDEIIGNPNVNLWKYPYEKEKIFALLRIQGSVRDYEVTLQKKDGSSVPVSVSTRFYTDEKGEEAGAEGIFRDISERKIAEQELVNRNKDLISLNEELISTLQDLTATENELASRNKELREQQQILNQSHSALREANRQLNLLSSITRHDILNKITVLNGFLSIIREETKDPGIIEYLDILESTTGTIQSQIAFTRIYQDLGTQEPQWIPVTSLISSINVPEIIQFSSDIDQIEIYADPICGKVFENLLDNTIRHGQHVTKVQISAHQAPEGLYIIWEDDGIGIAATEKERIFERGYGKNTGFGLFLVREILSITGIQIRETGSEGVGARFEILVPEGGFKIRNTTEEG
jgi:PAS domain S-box-containing protein